MQKETTIKEKKLYMHRHFGMYRVFFYVDLSLHLLIPSMDRS